MKAVVYNGEEMSIAHLAPMEMQCACEGLGRPVLIRVIFANHCYSEAFDAARHQREQIILYDGRDRPRVFCPIRYALSHRLPEIIASLPEKRVHQTAQHRNYVYVVPLEIEGQWYEIYFQIQRADDGVDLRLSVESAYAVDAPQIRPKRPRQIRFGVLAFKVLMRQQIRFAPR